MENCVALARMFSIKIESDFLWLFDTPGISERYTQIHTVLANDVIEVIVQLTTIYKSKIKVHMFPLYTVTREISLPFTNIYHRVDHASFDRQQFPVPCPFSSVLPQLPLGPPCSFPRSPHYP